MNRFFGMMPNSEIEITKHFKDKCNRTITIEAGPHGWTIMWPDMSTNYKDVDATAEENYNEAYNTYIDLTSDPIPSDEISGECECVVVEEDE